MLAARDGMIPGAPADVADVAAVPGDPAAALLGAGGGRPSTGYIGASFILPIPTTDELDGGVAADINYTHNFSESLSMELGLGLWQYSVTHAGDDGSLNSISFGGLAQYGRGYGAIKWYLGVGLAYLVNELSGVSAVDADDSLAFLLAAGTDIPLSARGSLCIEVRGMLATAELSDGSDLDLTAPALRLNYVFLY
jgi:hypothetical protein